MASKQIQKSYERLSLIASKEFMNLPSEINVDMKIAGVKQMTGNRELTRECEWSSCKALGVYELMEPEPRLGGAISSSLESMKLDS